MNRAILASVLALLHSIEAVPCTETTFICGQGGYQIEPDGGTEFCSRWAPDSVCYSGKCYTPAACTLEAAAVSVVSKTSSPSCADTGYVCHGEEEGSSAYCEEWADNSVCREGRCYTPRSCNSSVLETPSVRLKQLREKAALLEDLLKRLEAPGEDQDSVDDVKFEHMIREMEGDAPDKDFAADMTISTMVNVYRALGYKDTVAMGASIMRAFFDDEIVVNNKAAITGELRSDSFTIRSCVNLGQKETSIPALMFVNKWNVEKRLSTAYFDKDNTFCLQSDAFLTKYSKANVQIAKEQAAIFTVSIQVFHRELLLALVATGNAEEL